MSQKIRDAMGWLQTIEADLKDALAVQKATNTHPVKLTAWCGGDDLHAGYRDVILPKDFARQVIDQHVENLTAEVEILRKMVAAAETAIDSFKPKDFRALNKQEPTS